MSESQKRARCNGQDGRGRTLDAPLVQLRPNGSFARADLGRYDCAAEHSPDSHVIPQRSVNHHLDSAALKSESRDVKVPSGAERAQRSSPSTVRVPASDIFLDDFKREVLSTCWRAGGREVLFPVLHTSQIPGQTETQVIFAVL